MDLELQIIGLAAAFMAFKFAETLVKQFLKKRNGNNKKSNSDLIHELAKEIPNLKGLKEDEKEMITELYRLYTKTDTDGIPLAYYPRTNIEEIKKLKGIIHAVSERLNQNSKTLEDIWTKLYRS